MINTEEKESIKQVLGHRYVQVIQEELNRNGERNRNGLPYSDSQITNVMNGTAHRVIEAAIFSVVEKTVEENLKREALLKEKSAAATADS